ncbi:unnamed protein product [Effrenium voratum]|uniref:Uncharacterized protein n=1 Tax=Effrenium voratum TaxID=2562239 RepID=A0AA36I7G6_9DINO|nr:unnamed protein product [Effrenium voratum]CAJ1438536.1 unnamed protein product [Effrenium voratum]|mmetsp:Transcript_59898/g.143086  ORF Transcript_59898/g.143086 Transcript_59898/m.143086 type:complete len:204 (+) Transcript_59898:75-686(+)|eukprot:CAMPEP_0181428558 /NCGR_PEP_ID=MMETSP1110-20121109/16742_1 /TAXON_ID=174948 /ORGANISM="Symbiodinium sp., Strain CCMP421" /LENGTH=203 /DNA_ID=CAMNT_0023551791 /DNA_START=69 /DNA_END=680 /DNA_ORIENTATION=+
MNLHVAFVFVSIFLGLSQHVQEVEVSAVGAVQPHSPAHIMRAEGFAGIRAHQPELLQAGSIQDPAAAATAAAATAAATAAVTPAATAAATAAVTPAATTVAATTAAATTAAATSTTSTTTTVTNTTTVLRDESGARVPTTMTVVVTHIEIEYATVVFTEEPTTTTSTTTTSTTNTTTTTPEPKASGLRSTVAVPLLAAVAMMS